MAFVTETCEQPSDEKIISYRTSYAFERCSKNIPYFHESWATCKYAVTRLRHTNRTLQRV